MIIAFENDIKPENGKKRRKLPIDYRFLECERHKQDF